MQRSDSLELSSTEQNYLEKLLKMRPQELKDVIRAFIHDEGQLSLLLRFAQSNAIINALCQSQEFDEDWTDIWKTCGKFMIPSSTNQNEVAILPAACDFLPQTTLSSFELTQGIHLYWMYSETENDKTLHDAVKHGCYFAFNELCFKKIGELQSLETQKEYLDLSIELIKTAEIAAKLHWTPGYILLAKVCLQLARHADHFCDSGQAYTLKYQYHKVAYRAVHIAEKITDCSQAAIHNATLNGRIQLTDGLPFTTWLAAKKYISGLFDGGLSSRSLDDIRSSSQVDIETIRSQAETSVSANKYARLIN